MNGLSELHHFVVEAGKRFERDANFQLWWRGEPRVYSDLSPKVFRKEDSGEYVYLEFEAYLINNFRRKAKVRSSKLPADDDMAGWLSVAQHFGLPTRLLDWSSSPLVAAFFAVEEYPDAPGVIWALDWAKLNQGDLQLPTFGDPTIGQLVSNAFTSSRKSDSIIAVAPDELDQRMSIQSSFFTLHDSVTPLNGSENRKRFVTRLEIRPELKRELRQALSQLGINRSYLFPDLGNLAADLQQRVLDTHSRGELPSQPSAPPPAKSAGFGVSGA